MTRVGWFFAAAALVAATSASATTYPGPGTYAASVYVSQTTGSDCLDYYGLSFTGVLNYGGLDDDRAGLRLPLGDERDVSIQTLTTKSGIGTLTPSGTFIWKVGGFQPFTGTWSASLTVVDTVSFVAAITEKYDGCTEYLSVALTRVGNHQN